MDQLPTSVLVAEDFRDAKCHGQSLARFCREMHSRVLITCPEGEIAAGSGLQHLEPALAPGGSRSVRAGFRR